MSLDLAFKNTTGDYTGTGAGLAGRLTSLQADNNNWLIKQAVETLQAGTGKTISSTSATGNQLTITYSDATTSTVTLPTATWTWRGEFAAVSYAANDLFSNYGTIYLVLQAHTGELPFDPGRQISSADVYQKILDFPAVPGKTVTTDTYSPVLADANSYMRFTNTSGCAITIDPAVEFPDWTEMHFRNESSLGALTFDASTPAVINPQFGCQNISGGKGSTITLKKNGSADEWDIMGLLIAEVSA